MDPLAALQTAQRAYAAGDYDQAREFLNNYREWRKAGGFEPAVPEGADNAARVLGKALAQNFRVTFEILTDERAVYGDEFESGDVIETRSLRDALKALNETRTNRVDGVQSIEPDCIPCNWPRSICVINGMEFETGATETRCLHIPPHITRGSARRIARLCNVADICMTLD